MLKLISMPSWTECVACPLRRIRPRVGSCPTLLLRLRGFSRRNRGVPRKGPSTRPRWTRRSSSTWPRNGCTTPSEATESGSRSPRCVLSACLYRFLVVSSGGHAVDSKDAITDYYVYFFLAVSHCWFKIRRFSSYFHRLSRDLSDINHIFFCLPNFCHCSFFFQ